jgi:C-terminal processing protease CtpA/Prc
MFRFFLFWALLVATPAWAQTKYQKDFAEFWQQVNDHYAYLRQQQIDWPKVRAIYQPLADQATSDRDFVRLLEATLHELHNGHSSLGINLPSSSRLVPSGLDVRVETSSGRYFVADLRPGHPAERCGLQIGLEITAFNGQPVGDLLGRFLPRHATNHSPAMVQYALDVLFAGTHDQPRQLTALVGGAPRNFWPDSVGPAPAPSGLLEHRWLNRTTAYVKVHNSLGNHELIAEMDWALDQSLAAKTLTIDLTETPSGGNTTVARALMGRLVAKPGPYQRHEFDELAHSTRRHWVEYVYPRGATFRGKVYVLVGRWTGSMGEGLAIGLDALGRATVVGTPMAGLLGAISGFRLPETGIGFQLPTERLYHVDGTPREQYRPKVLTKNVAETLDFLQKIR